jgi:hypothetical protein
MGTAGAGHAGRGHWGGSPIVEEAVVEVRVGTWNLENLFLPGEQFGPPPEVFEQKLTGLADTISRMNPDLLGVQEVGSPHALDNLVARLDGDWHVALSAHFDARHPIRVGFLSRHPLEVLDDRRILPAGLAPVQVSDPGPDGTLASATQAGRGALAVRIHPRPAGGRCRRCVVT